MQRRRPGEVDHGIDSRSSWEEAADRRARYGSSSRGRAALSLDAGAAGGWGGGVGGDGGAGEYRAGGERGDADARGRGGVGHRGGDGGGEEEM